MFAGKLDKRISLQRRSVVRDTFGSGNESFSNLGTVWAEVRGVSGKEFFESRIENAEDVLEFKIRYREDLSRVDRVVYNGQIYDIINIKEIGRKVGLTLKGRMIER